MKVWWRWELMSEIVQGLPHDGVRSIFAPSRSPADGIDFTPVSAVHVAKFVRHCVQLPQCMPVCGSDRVPVVKLQQLGCDCTSGNAARRVGRPGWAELVLRHRISQAQRCSLCLPLSASSQSQHNGTPPGAPPTPHTRVPIQSTTVSSSSPSSTTNGKDTSTTPGPCPLVGFPPHTCLAWTEQHASPDDL